MKGVIVTIMKTAMMKTPSTFGVEEESKVYWVQGGVYKDASFINPPMKWIEHGPYKTYQEAYDKWRQLSFLNVDNALYRLRIIESFDRM